MLAGMETDAGDQGLPASFVKQIAHARATAEPAATKL